MEVHFVGTLVELTTVALFVSLGVASAAVAELILLIPIAAITAALIIESFNVFISKYPKS
jgi:hypothetical protein